MAGSARFALSASALATAAAPDVNQVFAVLCGAASIPTRPSERTPECSFEELRAAAERSCQRWGAARVGLVAATAPDDTGATDLGELLDLCNARGPALRHIADTPAGARAVDTATRWLACGIVDAALVSAATAGEDASSAWLLIERRGSSELLIARATEDAPCWRADPNSAGSENPLTDLGRLGPTSALAYAAIAGQSITQGRRPAGGGEFRRGETDRVELGFGAWSFVVEIDAS